MTTAKSSNKKPLRSAILAIGTELVEGQILNRNTQWISSQLRDLGFDVARHETLPDDHELIREALDRVASSVDLLFVTGGLGPTSDDFTREVIADWMGEPLEWHELSWRRILDRLTSLGIVVAESNRQQCYFPKSAEVLTNSQGTASGFRVSHKKTQAWILPGPPRELEAIWKDHIDSYLRPLAPLGAAKKLQTWRCIGKSEAALGELVEETLKGSKLEIGYRAHLPYVEVKIWCEQEKLSSMQEWFDRLTQAVRPWLVSRDDEDVAKGFLNLLPANHRVWIHDAATEGYLAERLGSLLAGRDVKLRIQTDFGFESEPENADPNDLHFFIKGVSSDGSWSVSLQDGGNTQSKELKSPYKIPQLSDRNRRLTGELALFHFSKWLSDF